jgi:hypothetical protein
MATICTNLAALGYSERDIRALTHDTEFAAIRYRSHQICFFADFADQMLHRAVSVRELATLFNANRRTVQKNLTRGPEDPAVPGRHNALDDVSEAAIVATVLESFRVGEAMRVGELLTMVQKRHNPRLTRGWVHAFLGRHLGELKICRSLPQEDLRLVIPRAYLEDHIRLMREHITGKFSELVFNLDEVGSSDWEDRKPRKVIAPLDVAAGNVFHPVSRKYRHVTLLACVSAAGDALTPMIISQTPVRDSLWRQGLRQDEDVMVRQRSPAYVNEELFYEYLTEVFVPYVNSLRRAEPFSGQLAVCLMDSASPHVSERCLRYLGGNGILVVAFPAHTTNIFQALDLVFFGALKKRKAGAGGEFGDGSVEDQITKLVRAYEQTATSATIRGSFRKAGMVPDTSERPFKLVFDEARVRENEGFKEIWDRDIKIEELSRRRQAHRFGIMNSQFLKV